MFLFLCPIDPGDKGTQIDLGVLPQEASLIKYLKKTYSGEGYKIKSEKFKISFYETNKIRKLLARYYNSGGYPVKYNYHVGYYSGIAMWIPDQWAISGKETRNLWSVNPSFKWREVIMYKVDLYDRLHDEYAKNIAKLTVGMIPLLGGLANVITRAEADAIMLTRAYYKIYPNILFYNTINNWIIYANWLAVRIDVNIIEKLKYLPPESEVVVPSYPRDFYGF